MISINAKTFRQAILEQRFEDDEHIYKFPPRETSEADLETFLGIVNSRAEPLFCKFLLTNDGFYKVQIWAKSEIAGDDFSEEINTEEKLIRIHSFVHKKTGNVFLASPDEKRPISEYGSRCNVHDPKVADYLKSDGNLFSFHAGAAILLKLGVDINEGNYWGETGLMVACSSLRYGTVDWLLKHDANPNTKTKGSLCTALHRAVEATGSDEDIAEIVSLLIEHGADVNSATYWSVTPLMIASYKGLKSTCLVLIKRGASLLMKTSTGLTADMVAGNDEYAKSNSEEIKAILKQ